MHIYMYIYICVYIDMHTYRMVYSCGDVKDGVIYFFRMVAYNKKKIIKEKIK